MALLGWGSLVLVLVAIPRELAPRRRTTYLDKTLPQRVGVYVWVLGHPLFKRRAGAAVGGQVSRPDQLHDVGCQHVGHGRGAPLEPSREQ